MKYIFVSVALIMAGIGVAGAKEITKGDLAGLPIADVVILGEIHDNAQHHIGQADAILAIRPTAVVFEMLTPTQAAKITPQLLKDQGALAAALDWDASGWPDFALYYPVFEALGAAKVYGAARSRDEVRRAFGDGAAAVFGPKAAMFGLDQPLPTAQLEQRMQEQFEAHCDAMPLEMMGGMVEAQRFRDAAFGAVVMQAFEEVGGPVVLITGNGHARMDWGVPAMLAIGAPDLSVLVVGFIEAPAQAEQPFDLWLVTEPAIRKDPCLAFK
ncbi:MAG: ChaN family lipoprotein [Marinosulfonomonas sp.]|nr:ChaN family lipoprotein [Marinosulfonomonas sp.]